jgi:glycerol-3-phosphate acyltransferase PlsX
MRIALDAMGGDNAPVEVVHGAVAAAAAGIDVILVGDRDRVASLLHDAGADLEIVHAGQVIEMADDPARSIRDKKDASVSVAARLVAEGRANGMVSAGSTGASMAAAALMIGRLPGVARPAIASFFPSGKFVLDSGANLECRPEHLVQFAIMGRALSQTYVGLEQPRIGLVSIGEERGKGRSLEREAFALLEQQPNLNFVGNVEGRDIAGDRADVLVTDGFTGNVLLKTAEGAVGMVMGIAAESVGRLGPDQADGLAPVMSDLARHLSPDRHSGGHLVGTQGVVVIAHGSSSRAAISNAIQMAAEGAASGLVSKIASGLAAVPASAG